MLGCESLLGGAPHRAEHPSRADRHIGEPLWTPGGARSERHGRGPCPVSLLMAPHGLCRRDVTLLLLRIVLLRPLFFVMLPCSFYESSFCDRFFFLAVPPSLSSAP